MSHRIVNAALLNEFIITESHVIEKYIVSITLCINQLHITAVIIRFSN